MSHLRMRKLGRLMCVCTLVGCIIYVAASILFGAVSLQDRYQYKRQVMQDLIHSAANNAKCTIPNLPLFSPEMMSFIHDEKPINCTAAGTDWVECRHAVCSVKPAIVAQHGRVTCDYSEIVRRNDYDFRYRETVRTDIAYTLRASDFVHVKCWPDDGAWTVAWSGVVFGLRELPRLTAVEPTKRPDDSTRRDLNILMLGFDSLSRNSFMRKLPKSYAFLSVTLGADVLTGYNIVGDGTPQALIPLLTGRTELELPETRRRMANSQTVDGFPFIWKDFERLGYVTAFNEDLPNAGTFTYRLNGFGQQPTTHYMRTYYLAIEPELVKQPELCIGQHPRHQVMLNYTRQFMEAYRERPHFVFSFHGELSHDSINLVGVADDDLERWLRALHTDGLLSNTLLIVMSDHGNRFAEVRDTLQGKLEERLPFFSFVFPEWFKAQHEAEYRTFRGNKERLVTPFDVHATLEDLFKMQSGDGHHNSVPSAADDTGRDGTLSLFTRIPETRTCADASIEPHWCVCLSWQPIDDLQSESVMKLARSVVDAINKFTATSVGGGDQCARLYVHAVKWAAKLSPQDNLLRFRKSSDDDGFLADFAAKSMVETASEMYQVKLTVRPGDSVFEASVQHHPKSGEFVVDLAHVSRVNKYGAQAACIMESNPELRKFCNCKARGDE